MATSSGTGETDLKAEILGLLDENRVMTVATLRPDGWPQATLVGYASDDLTLYFAVARSSQKFANIERDPRVSLALGQHTDRLRGLSMAAHAAEVTDRGEIEHLEALMMRRYPHQSRFSPRQTPSVLLCARPTFISVIDLGDGPGDPDLALVSGDGAIHRLHDTSAGGGRGVPVDVQALRSGADVYRPGAPL